MPYGFLKARWEAIRSTQALLVMAAAAQYQPVGVLDPVIVGLILLLTVIDDNETPHTKTSRITSWEECFDRWNDAETSLHFRFSRAELRDLSNAIGFPETVVIGQTAELERQENLCDGAVSDHAQAIRVPGSLGHNQYDVRPCAPHLQ